MRRNLSTYGMNWKEREEYRLARKVQIANEKNAKTETLSRLTQTILAIEEAFKPEADKLHKSVVTAWMKAHAYVLNNGKTYNAVRIAKTGRDFEANPIPEFKGQKYQNGRGYGDTTNEYYEYMKETNPIRNLKNDFNQTLESVIITRGLYSNANITDWATKQADDILEANKAKLLDGIARYLRPYSQVEVTGKNLVKAYVKGFQGEFELITDKGARLFTCKAITAEGPVVSFHWRYIIHVKEI